MKVLNAFSQRSLHLIHLLPFLCHGVAANTEIINFWPSREPRIDVPRGVVRNGSTLNPTDNERRWSLEPAALHTPLHQVCERTDAEPPSSCPHELWLFLDLNHAEWASYATFTLRLSWAASTPADFAIALYSPQEVLAQISSDGVRTSAGAQTSSSSTVHTLTTRSKYARIRAVNAGVPTPGPRRTTRGAGIQIQRTAPATRVPFIVILEPTYAGVLPASLLPTVGFLVPIVLAAVALVPWVMAYVEPFARQARADASSIRMTSTSTDKAR